jgi:hypothetical protein
MDIVLYSAEDGAVQLEVQLDRETVWLTQRQMADLFDKDTDTIGLHIRNIYKEGELSRKGATEEFSFWCSGSFDLIYLHSLLDWSRGDILYSSCQAYFISA